MFIDPDDAEDIFPKDFIVALTRPPGYMGASDFHDFDPKADDDDRPVANPGEKAYVRNLPGADRRYRRADG